MQTNFSALTPTQKTLAGLVLAAIGIALWQAPLAQWLQQASAWQTQNPTAAAMLYLAFVALGTPLMVPGSVLMMTGGFLFGAVGGFGLAAVGVTVGATLSCLVGRRLARDAVLRAMAHQPVFHGLEQALRARGFLVVLLTRFSLLIPFTLLNYAYGVSSVSLSRYVPATALGMLPAVALFVYLGSVASDVDALLASNAAGGATGKIVVLVGVVAMILATWVIHRTATAELRKHMGPSESRRQTP